MPFGGAVKLTGESEYKTALAQITQRLKEVSSEMKVVTSAYDKNDNSAEALNAKQKTLAKTYEEQKSKVKTLVSQYNSMSKSYDSNEKKHKTLVKEYESEKSKLEKLGKTLGTTSTEYKEQEKKVNTLAAEVKKSTKAQDANEKSMSEMRIEINKAQADCNRTAKEIDNLGDETQETGKEAKEASDGFTVFKGALASLVADGIRSAINGLKDMARSVVETGINFDSAMSQVGAISGATADEMQKLRDKAKEMGSTTKFTATEAGEAFNYMAMAGWGTDEMLEGINGIMALAAASGADLATTSDIVTDALTAMGYSAGEAGHLADVMAAASANANTNVVLMGKTFQYAAPIAGALGYSMEDVAVAIGLMANAGIKGEKAGTALRSILTRLSAPPKECSEAMDRLGISMTDSEGNMKSLDTILAELRGAFSGLSETEQTAEAKHIAGAEAMAGLLAIVNASPEAFQQLIDAVNNSNGAAQEMADTMLDNLGGDITLLQSAFEGFQLTLYETSSGAMRSIVQEVTDELIPALTDMATGAEGGAESVGVAFSNILNNLITTIGAMLPQLVTMGTSLVTNLIVGIMQNLPTLVENGMTAINALLQGVQAGIPLIIAEIPNMITGIILAITNSLPTIIESGVGILTALVDGINTALPTMIENVPVIITSLVTAFTESLPTVLEAGKSLLTAIIDGIITNLPSLVNALPDVINTVITALTDAMPSVMSASTDMFMEIVNSIPTIVTALVEAFPSIINTAVNGLTTALPNITTAATTMFTGIINAIPQLVSDLITNLPTIISTIVSALIEAVPQIVEAAFTMFMGIVTAIPQMIVELVKQIPSIITSIVEGLTEGITSVTDVGTNLIEGLWNGINNATDWIIGKIKGFGESVLSGLKRFFGIKSPSRVFRDEIGVNLAKGIGVGFDREMKEVTSDMQSAIPTSFDLGSTVNGGRGGADASSGNDGMVNAFKSALSQMKIELDDEVAGRFVERTVAEAIYA